MADQQGKLAIVHEPRTVTPLLRVHSHALDCIEPGWGFCRNLAEIDLPILDRPLPTMPVLREMEREVQLALEPCGRAEGAKAAAALIESYPQSSAGLGATYADMLVMRFAECPPDQLPAVLNRLIDENPDFRPAPGKVKQTIDRLLNKRRLWLMRVQAAIRYHEATLLQHDRDQRIEADKAKAAQRLARVIAEAARPDPDPKPDVIAQPAPERRAVKDRRPLTPEQLQQFRARAPVKSQRPPK